VRDCLQLDPKQRSSTADILKRLSPGASHVEHKPDVGKEGWRGNRKLATLFILATALVIAFIVFLSGRKSESPKSAQTAVEQPVPNAAPAEPAVVSSAPQATSKRDSAGSVLHQALPEISPSARNTIRGKIRIVARVEVDASGKVTHARLTTSGPSRYFARLALDAAERWQFSPPVMNSKPAASVWSITFRIARKQTQAAAQRVKR
jgi:TonB family protein